MDSFVFTGHDDSPEGRLLHFACQRRKSRMIQDHLSHSSVDFASVLSDFRNGGPRAMIFGEIVPGHLVKEGGRGR